MPSPMEHTNNRLQKHWPKAKVFIRQKWPKITEVELKRINGDFDLFTKYFNEFYNDFPFGEAKARTDLQKFLNTCDTESPEGLDA